MQTDSGISSGSMRIKSEIYEYVESIIFSLAVVVLIFTFIFRIVGVVNISMQNTLFDGNRLILYNINYSPKQGDIIVFSALELNEPLIKRVIAVGGQKVDINYNTHTVYVDDKAQVEPYIKEKTSTQGDVKLPVTVPLGYVFVMGDNRNYSLDSRFSQVGMIDQRYIIGKAIFRIFPLNRFGRI
jgi:signal peptidase I